MEWSTADLLSAMCVGPFDFAQDDNWLNTRNDGSSPFPNLGHRSCIFIRKTAPIPRLAFILAGSHRNSCRY